MRPAISGGNERCASQQIVRPKIDWSGLALDEEPPTAEEIEADRERKWQDKFEADFRKEAFYDSIESLALDYQYDPEGLWNHVVASVSTSPEFGLTDVLRALRDCRNADVTGTDPILLMESFMESDCYRLAVHAKLALGNTIRP